MPDFIAEAARKGYEEAMKDTIQHADESAEFFTSEQCHILELSNTPDDPTVSIARARVEPSVTTLWHRVNGTTERYVILEGRGRVEIGQLPPEDVGPGAVVTIPPNCRQRIENLGDSDLLFLAICTPRFLPENYEELDF